MELGHKSSQPELPSWMCIEDVEENEFAKQAAQQLPLILPWGSQPVRLGATYDSKLQNTSDPWVKTTPFILSDLFTIPKVLKHDFGCAASFKSVTTARQCETGDHLSLGFGAGVGLPFLASVSVLGQYDNHVQDNNDSEKTSIRSSVRAGIVELSRTPCLTTQAKIALKYDGGYAAFCERFGDYYVAGYRLGGDTGLMISSSSFSRKRVDTYSIKVTVEVLIFEASKTWSKSFHQFTSGKAISLLGYDTLDHKMWNSSFKDDGVAQVMKDAEAIALRTQCILERVKQILGEEGLDDLQDLTEELCQKLMAANLVVELVLMPMSQLRDVVRWRNEKNVI